ncbi:alkyl/aryl-sulfatase [Streptomyces sp. HB2AG]|uniref:alkyl/aryl-sulfatase n=1 Tax=Streptomyces sp. HB2AG TaxID=2983400 RepID=UPI0022AB302D|nr:alkyl sulfatase dimerization domain-containing protein [Streptomyces sp. HB2AG]MCZ2523462.1 MBL fold metallo-hydrolase [Streptomyces sp. HB2AG]
MAEHRGSGFPEGAGTPGPDDGEDLREAGRGFVAAQVPGAVRDADGRVVWDADAYGFLAGPPPDTADPLLWRQGRLRSRQGLYEVTDGVYQVRGLDLAHMTLVESGHGVVVVDPLGSAETAAAALALYRGHRGPRPVTGVVLAQAHTDHFGGVKGVLPPAEEGVPVLAPAGFLEHAVSETVYAGPVAARGAVRAYGTVLPKAPDGQIGAGPGPTASTGTLTLVRPTVEVVRAGQEEVVDGVRFVLQPAPGAGAPAATNFLLPERRALFVVENAAHALQDVPALCGARAGDARAWARFLDGTVRLLAGSADVLLSSHHWPTWGRERVERLLCGQRDLFAYLHDQTLRLANQGLTAAEAAERFRLPPPLERLWRSRGHYGPLDDAVRAVHRRWTGSGEDGPARRWGHPPADAGRRYVECLGGGDAVVARAREYAAAGDLRFAATLLDHVVLAEPGHSEARGELASVYRRLGYASADGGRRNAYLTAALELQGELPKTDRDVDPEAVSALTVDQIVDSLAARVNGPRAWEMHLVMDWSLVEESRVWRLTLSNGALTSRSFAEGEQPPGAPAGLSLTLSRTQLMAMLGGAPLEGVDLQGDPAILGRLVSVLDAPDLMPGPLAP